MRNLGAKTSDFSKRFLAHRYLPAIFAAGAVLVMLPALKTGLVLDDLPQRAVELRPDHPCPLESAYVPAYIAYHHQQLPKTIRVLVPGCTSFDVQRTDDKTLIIQSRGSNIFSCADVGPIHLAYTLSTIGQILPEPRCRKGDRCHLNGLTVEVLESDAAGLASRVAFRFDTPLDSPDFHWLWWNWQTFGYETFKVPAIGQSVTLSGPARWRLPKPAAKGSI